MPRHDRVDRPVANHGIHRRRQIASQRLASSNGQLVYSVSAQNVSGIPVAAGIVAIGVVEVLPVIARRTGLGRSTPGAVVAVVIRHTLLEGVGDLTFKTMPITLLQHNLHGVVVHVADGSGVLYVAEL